MEEVPDWMDTLGRTNIFKRIFFNYRESLWITENTALSRCNVKMLKLRKS